MYKYILIAPHHIARISSLQRKLSVAVINSDSTADTGMQSEGTLHDPRLGVLDRGQICATCKGNFETCPGHFGHIELARPMYNMGYIRTIISVLKCVCFNCSRLLCSKVFFHYNSLV